MDIYERKRNSSRLSSRFYFRHRCFQSFCCCGQFYITMFSIILYHYQTLAIKSLAMIIFEFLHGYRATIINSCNET